MKCEILHIHLAMDFKETKQVKWLIKNKDVIKIHMLARKVGMPGSTLKMFVDGQRGTIPEQYENQLIAEIKKILVI